MIEKCPNCKSPLYLRERKWCPVCGYRDTFWNRLKSSNLVWWIVVIAVIYIVGKVFDLDSTSSNPPVQNTPATPAVIYDPCAQDLSNGVPYEYSRCSDSTLEPLSDPVDTLESNDSETCNIKGNISESGEKIYHMPGQYYYDVTIIDTSAGERWFCTEQEAKANGWRKSFK